MILDKIKERVKSKVGVRCKFVFHGSRNQKEEFYGVINKTYPAIFLIEDEYGQNRTFCYNDVLISVLEIHE